VIYIIKGRQRVGKTTLSTGLCMYLVQVKGYKLKDLVSNCHFYLPDGSELPEYQYLPNSSMKAYVRDMVKSGARNKIIHIDEIDRVFSHRFWSNKAQAEALLGLWQDEKLGDQIIGTAHIGKSIDNLIRECMQIEIIALKRDVKRDIMTYGFINILNRERGYGYMNNLALVQRCFDTREAIV